MNAAATLLLDGGLRQGCILHTPKLSLWKIADRTLWFDVPQLPASEIIGLVGTGDAVAAGILYGLPEGSAPADCVGFGTKMATAFLRSPTATGGIVALKDL